MEIYLAIRDLVHSLAVFPDKAPFAGCESDGLIESVQFGGGAYNLPKRRLSRASTYNSGEDIATTSRKSMMHTHIMGKLASPLYTQDR